MADISLFPMITEEHAKKVVIKPGEFEFFYSDDDGEWELKFDYIEGNDTSIKLSDEDGYWNIDRYNFGVSKTYSFDFPSYLFGANGVAANSATIGVALIWTSPDSYQRGAIPFGELSSNSKKEVFQMEHIFPKKELRGEVQLSTVLYLKNPGHPRDDERHLANLEGTILGTIDQCTIILDGKGSIFPIYIVENPGQPLWYLKASWVDINDSFMDTVEINLNKSHKNYKYLDVTKKTFDKQLLIEIVASAVCQIIEKARENEDDWNIVDSDERADSGTVAEALQYFKSKLPLDMTDSMTLSMSLRKYLEKGF